MKQPAGRIARDGIPATHRQAGYGKPILTGPFVAHGENEAGVKISSAADGVEKISQLPKSPAKHQRASLRRLGVVEGMEVPVQPDGTERCQWAGIPRAGRSSCNRLLHPPLTANHTAAPSASRAKFPDCALAKEDSGHPAPRWIQGRAPSAARSLRFHEPSRLGRPHPEVPGRPGLPQIWQDWPPLPQIES